MRTRDTKIAEQFGILVRCKAFEEDPLAQNSFWLGGQNMMTIEFRLN